jgi:MFS family permease
LFAFTLPHTPPRKVGRDVPLSEILGLDALSLLRKPSFAVFVLCLFLICIPMYFYFVNMGVYLPELKWPNMAARMTWGQVSDVIFLFMMPFALKRFGFKKTLLCGMLAWAIRYFLLSQSVSGGETQTALIFSAILLHGICYDFLFIAGQLYIDREATERNRGACQGFIAFILWGIGAFVGTWLAGRVQGMYEIPQTAAGLTHDWQTIWMIPAIGAAVVMVLFMAFFREPKKFPQPETLAKAP